MHIIRALNTQYSSLKCFFSLTLRACPGLAACAVRRAPCVVLRFFLLTCASMRLISEAGASRSDAAACVLRFAVCILRSAARNLRSGGRAPRCATTGEGADGDAEHGRLTVRSDAGWLAVLRWRLKLHQHYWDLEFALRRNKSGKQRDGPLSVQLRCDM